MKNYIFIFFVVGLFISGCSSIQTEKSNRVEQRIIFPQYSLTYDADSETLIASAQFNTNNPAGTFIKLSSNSSITFNENRLKATENRENFRFYYTYKSTETLPQKAVFEYVNDDKKQFTNAIHIHSFELKERTYFFKTKEEKVIPFIGKALNENETLEGVVTNNNHEIINTFFPILRERSILISADMISLNSGRYFLHFIRRESSSKVNALDRGGLIEVEYHSKKIEVEI